VGSRRDFGCREFCFPARILPGFPLREKIPAAKIGPYFTREVPEVAQVAQVAQVAAQIPQVAQSSSIWHFLGSDNKTKQNLQCFWAVG